jgi:tetratricopeptide (TPR) repeat protein
MNGLTLKALCSYYRAAGKFGQDQERYARESIDTSLKAIQAAEGKKDAEGLVAYNHVNISMVNVLLANNLRSKEDKSLMDAALKKAREHGEEATRLQPKNPRTWWTLGNVLEDLAWSRLGNQPALFPMAAQAFETQIRCREAAPEGYVNLARVYIKWAQDDRKDFNANLEKARKNLKFALEKKGSYAEAHYWQGALDLLEGNRDEALKAFAKAVSDSANPRLWLSTIRDHINNGWKEEERVKAWEDLFGHVLPAGQPAKPEQALPLTLRAEVLFAIPEVKGDLKRLERLIGDVDQAAKLANDNGKARAYALSLAAQFRWEAAKLSLKDQKAGYNEAADEKVREMLKADPNIGYAHIWAGGLAQRLEAKSKREGLSPAAKAKLLREAIEYATLAVAKAPESEKRDLKEGLARLRQFLRELGTEPSDGY